MCLFNLRIKYEIKFENSFNYISYIYYILLLFISILDFKIQAHLANLYNDT